LTLSSIDSTLKLKDIQGQQKTDEGLDFEEFAKLMRPTLSDPHRLTSKQTELQEAFHAFDKDGDGFINVEELQAMMKNLGDPVTLDEAKQLIEEADRDDDGVVNFSEFSVMMGIQQPAADNGIKKRSECPHHQHNSSIRRFFCSHK
jgi:Ca2+-binding EF-hand superfamily protein